MHVGRVNDGDIQFGLTCTQAGGDCDASRPAADDHDVLSVNNIHQRFSSMGDTLHHGLKVKTRLGRTFLNLACGQLSDLRQGPQSGGPSPGTRYGNRPG